MPQTASQRFQKWYMSHKEELNAKRRERRKADPERMEHVNARRREMYRLKKALKEGMMM